MSSDLVLKRLLHIRDNICHARDFLAGLDFDAFAADQKTVYATMRALEIISEASRHLPEDLKARHPEIDWVAVRDAGNVYRHGYELVTEQRLWDTITKHLAPLENAVLDELSRLA
ncbi:MAG TPA: HepT-like ribonuclease domain-containing protein [Rhizomicrobium sp.]|jgi:uncharacterized protein with HEPN domain|nr:HepT-like ribonuclease domain-containing protein [Rhizomicrobium sp.]